MKPAQCWRRCYGGRALKWFYSPTFNDNTLTTARILQHRLNPMKSSTVLCFSTNVLTNLLTHTWLRFYGSDRHGMLLPFTNVMWPEMDWTGFLWLFRAGGKPADVHAAATRCCRDQFCFGRDVWAPLRDVIEVSTAVCPRHTRSSQPKRGDIYMYTVRHKKELSIRRDAHERKLVPFLCLTVYMVYWYNYCIILHRTIPFENCNICCGESVKPRAPLTCSSIRNRLNGGNGLQLGR